ncbi:MAG: glycosyltransferase family 39 protein, partial [Deltaproteobacteria bacterium]|nr:glycosyltransferase family 39 protein [Deltaproteobacteria bacterium]
VYLNQIISTPIFQGLAADAEKYESLALQILKGNLTHKDFLYLNPLYPFFLALIYLIFGHSQLAVVLIQTVVDSLSCILIYYIASMLFNKRAGIISALIYACYGIAIFYTGILLAPTVIIFFNLLFISSLLAAEKKRRVIIFFVSGILFGLAVLARPNVILFIFALPLWFFTVLKNKLGIRKSIQGFLLLLIGFFMVISLITIRNYSIEKRFSLSALGGINFYIGNNSKAKGIFASPNGLSRSPIELIKTSIHYAEKESGKTLTPPQASRYWLFKGLKFIKDNPIDAFFLYMKKFSLFWRKEEIPVNIDYSFSKTFAPIFQLPFISFGILAPFAILGIIFSLKRKNNILLVTLFVLSYMVSVIIFFVSARYRLPIVPFLIICSSYALYNVMEMMRAKKAKDIIILVVALILLFVGINKDFEYLKFISDYEIAHYNLGLAYFKLGRLDEAIAEYKKALTINPNHAKAYNNLAWIYATSPNATIRNGDEAVALAIKACELTGFKEVKFLDTLAAAYAEQGNFKKAVEYQSRAINLSQDKAKPALLKQLELYQSEQAYRSQ